MKKSHYLIVKHGGLGDVVRTSYFAGALRRKFGDALRLSWLTSTAAAPLLRFNDDIDDIWTDPASTAGFYFDRVFSLDDEVEIVKSVAAVGLGRVTGAVSWSERRTDIHG